MNTSTVIDLHTTHRRPAVHRTIVVVDQEKFCDPARTNADRLVIRDGMYKAVRHALAASGVRWKDCSTTDCGDGVLVLIPPQVPKIRLVTTVLRQFAEALRRHNHGRRTHTRLRLRMAVHAGEVSQDAYGVVGSALNHAFRLIDTPELRSALGESAGDLALVVSEWFYHEVVRQDPVAEPTAFRQVAVAVKELRTDAWIRVVPANGTPPGSDASCPSGIS